MRTAEQIAFEQRSKRLTLQMQRRPKPKPHQAIFFIEPKSEIISPIPRDLIAYR